jgi:hypothetical protein
MSKTLTKNTPLLQIKAEEDNFAAVKKNGMMI